MALQSKWNQESQIVMASWMQKTKDLDSQIFFTTIDRIDHQSFSKESTISLD
jgi:hypothetical protein